MNEIEYELREKDIRFYNDIKLINNADFKRSMTQNQAIIPGALSVIAFFYFLYYQDFRTGLIIGAIGVVWGLAVPAYLRYSSWQQVRQKYSDSDLKNILGKRTLKIQPGRIIETKDGEESTIPWKDVMRIEVNKARTYGFIYFDHNAALIIPKKTVKKAKFMDFMVQAMEFHAEADDD
ncbi:MAG TPA: YcxB family protein [Crenotrichaceae bacterium]|nr:YcxB family protein [Crenotrichaceae bacterium]